MDPIITYHFIAMPVTRIVASVVLRYRGWKMNRILHAVLLGISLVFVPVSGWAQYPVKPIKVIVPCSPGTPPDIAARIIAQKLSVGLGQQMVVENRPGAGGTLGAAAAAKSPPD